MPAYHFYHPALTSTKISLEAEEFKHLKTVMRGQKGDTITLFDGKGTKGQARIDLMDKTKADLTLLSKKTFARPSIKTSIAIAHIRPQKMDECIEAISALGIDAIYTFPAKKSENQHHFSPNQKQRHEHILINSCKQSGQLFFPDIHYLKNMEDLPQATRFFCDPTAKKALLTALQEKSLQPNDHLQIIIGPESGFQASETKRLKENATPVLLGDNIYRSELACILSASLLKHFLFSRKSSLNN